MRQKRRTWRRKKGKQQQHHQKYTGEGDKQQDTLRRRNKEMDWRSEARGVMSEEQGQRTQTYAVSTAIENIFIGGPPYPMEPRSAWR
eukprot:6594645-Pyramimonas_sp.AAC.1